MDLRTAQRLVASKQFWYHKFEIYPGLWTPGVYDASGTLGALHLQQDLTGKRVLEIGPADGFFTRELHKKGADVLAIDYAARDRHGFEVTEALYGHPLRFKQANIYDLTPEEIGTWDIVLCLGVLYHLPDMFRALWILRHLCTGSLHLETAISSHLTTEPVAVYLPADSANSDWTNFWYPTPLCVESMLADAGFNVSRTEVWGTRAYFLAIPNPNPNGRFKAMAAYGAPTW